jgi:asparagine synthase (glutamine-hydrolysing)
MGVHAGIFFFDGRLANDACRTLTAGLQPIAPDGVSTYADAGIAMAHGAFHVWAGECLHRQPARSPAGLVALWDGRLDNRDDLLLRLGERPTTDMSDAELALATFERWGIDGLRSLIGEWSVAIWDACRRTLHLARDYIGARPLYYDVGSRSVLWSTSLGEIAGRSGRADVLSEAFVAGFMTLRLSSDVTPYEGIRAVPAACCVSFAPNGTGQRRQFWQLDPGVVRFRDKGLYEERLRALWSEAVGARLRADGTVWAELSGGLDSSSVVCMADRLIKGGRVPARAIQPLSHATLESQEGDERRFIADVETRIGVSSEILGVEEHQQHIDAELDWVTPFAARGVGLAAAQRIRERGGRLVLSGRVGDAVMGCEPDNSVAVFDDLAGWNLVQALSNIRRWSRSCRKPFVEIAWRLLQRRMPSGTVRSLEAHAAQATREGMDVLAPRLHGLVHDDGAAIANAVSNVRASKRDIAALVIAYAFGSRLNIPDTPGPLIYAYPFTHRPLVEYALAIPGEELSAPGEMRSLMRRAFDGLVPPRILRRTSKGYYPPSAVRAVRPLVASMRPTERLEVVQRGWIDPRRLDAAIGMFVDGAGSTSGEVRRVLRLEQWLTSRNRRAPAAIPQRKEVRSHEVLNA